MSFRVTRPVALVETLDAADEVIDSLELEYNGDDELLIDGGLAMNGPQVKQAVARAIAKYDAGEIGAVTQIGDKVGSEDDNTIEHREETDVWVIEKTGVGGGSESVSEDMLRGIAAGIDALGVPDAPAPPA